MSRPQPPFPSGLTRRRFLGASALAATGWVVAPSFLSGCAGDGSDSTSSAQPLSVDPNVPWWLQNNFDPVFDEVVSTDLSVRGRIPEGLNGLYVRNGSNPRNADSPHWFFGDGMVHGVRFENGRPVWYRNRYIQTPLYQQGLPFGGDLAPTGGNNQSNVSAVYHAGKLLTSGEVGHAYELDPSDLSTVGVYNFAGKLNTSFTAHPKIDPATGYMHFFGYWFVQPYLTYHVANAAGQIIHTQFINVRASTMIHSFAITDRDVVFWEMPVLFSLEDALAGVANPFSWQPSYGSRLGVMPLGGQAADIRWVEIEPCYVFHEVNAYRDANEIVVDVCRHDYMFANDDFGDAPLHLHRWRINTAGAALTVRDEVMSNDELELPSHDRRISGRRHRYGWMVETRAHPDTIDLAGVRRVDFETGRMDLWDPGITRHANEAFFVPGGPAEGEGWLLTFVHDHATDTSDLVILDALDLGRGPLAEVRLPRRVPHGFHATWIPA